ncbi:MAG: hypothetical protein WCL56_11105 [Sediminibacterium sp.]
MAVGGNTGADLKRAQIISLLYIIFVCFSVLNIKMSILDSNYYSIKSFEALDKENRKKIDLSNIIIKSNFQRIDSTNSGHTYLLISEKLNQSYNKVQSLLSLIDAEFKKNGQTVFTEFNKRNLIEKVLKSDNGIPVIKKDLFALAKYINSSPLKIPSYLDDFVPITDSILNFKGKKQLWESYLFLHKPTAMSYMQLVRIKLLITHTQLLYQEEALKQIGYKATYYSTQFPETYEVKNNIKVISEAIKEPVKPAVEEKVVNTKTSDIVIDDIFNKILQTIHTENIFAGLNTVLFSDFNFVVGKDVEIEIEPKVNVISKDLKFIANFNRVGEYELKFYDLRTGSKKLLFQKKVYANKMPDPILRIKGETLGNYNISTKDLSSSERLEAILFINNLDFFPGRINSYRVTRLHAGAEQESVINYGELFQSNTQKVFSNLQKNDFIIFDNMNVSLLDGTSRKPPPLLYKITN